MANTEGRKLWAVRPEDGRRFLDDNMISLGGSDLGDLSRLGDSREAFRAACEAARPDEELSVRTTRSTLCWRLAREIQPGDYAALVWGGQVWLGIVEGEYVWDADASGCEHRRTVRWEKNLPQDAFSRAALREVSSSPMPLFEVKGGGEQFLSAFSLPPLQASPRRTAANGASAAPGAAAGSGAAGTAAAKAGAGTARSGAAVQCAAVVSGGKGGKEVRTIWTEEPPDRSAEPLDPVPPRQGGWTAKPAAPEPLHPIPDNLVPQAIADPRRFLLEEWRRKLDADDLREFAAGLLRAMDYEVEPADDRADLTAIRDELTPPLLALVRYGTLAEADVEKLARSLAAGEFGVIFTLSDLSPEVRARMKSFPWVRCVDGKELAGLVLKYYGKLDEKYQQRIPLRMGYVPAT